MGTATGRCGPRMIGMERPELREWIGCSSATRMATNSPSLQKGLSILARSSSDLWFHALPSVGLPRRVAIFASDCICSDKSALKSGDSGGVPSLNTLEVSQPDSLERFSDRDGSCRCTCMVLADLALPALNSQLSRTEPRRIQAGSHNSGLPVSEAS